MNRELQSRVNELDGRVTTVVVQSRSHPSAAAGSGSSPSITQLEVALGSLRDECAALQRRQSALEQQTRGVTSPIHRPARNDAAADDSNTVALTVDDLHSTVDTLVTQRLEPVQDQLEDVRITVEEAVAELRQNIADISLALEDSVLRVVQGLRDMAREHDVADANEISTLADVFSILLSRGKSTDDTVVALSENMLGTVDLVQRHEAGFASIRELAEAIAFNAQNIVTLAAAVGLDKEAFTLKLNYDSFGDSTDDHGQNSPPGARSDE